MDKETENENDISFMTEKTRDIVCKWMRSGSLDRRNENREDLREKTEEDPFEPRPARYVRECADGTGGGGKGRGGGGIHRLHLSYSFIHMRLILSARRLGLGAKYVSHAQVMASAGGVGGAAGTALKKRLSKATKRKKRHRELEEALKDDSEGSDNDESRTSRLVSRVANRARPTRGGLFGSPTNGASPIRTRDRNSDRPLPKKKKHRKTKKKKLSNKSP